MSSEIGLPALSVAELTAWMRVELTRAETESVRLLRDVLLDLERADGVGEVHRLASELLRERMRPVRGERNAGGLTAFAAGPGGTYLAAGADTGDDYDRGGELAIWEARTGQVVHVVGGVRGGVGMSFSAGQLCWSADGETLYLGCDTNGVGRLDPFAVDDAAAMATAWLTDGWDSPPAWALGPDGELAVLVPGAVRDQMVACVRLDDEDVDNEDAEWLDNRVPEGLYDSDRTHLIDAVYSGARIWWMTADRILVQNGDELFAYDRQSRRLRWQCRVGKPVAVSDDGEYIAHHPAGIVFYDGAEGLPTPWMPMHVGASALVFTGARGAEAPPRMAAVIEADNPYDTEPGIHIYDAGEFVCGPDLSPAGAYGNHDFAVLAFSPDGGRFACLTAEEELQIWRLDGYGPGTRAECEHVLRDVVGVGLVWMQPDRLAVAGANSVTFVDPIAGRPLTPDIADGVIDRRVSWPLRWLRTEMKER